jgi:SWI/SNF-related matrix-associated actin-dependent regulator of chromatin subfamily B protein 1
MSASGTPQPQQQQQHQHFNAQPMHNQWNGAHHMAAVQPPGSDRGYAPDAQSGSDASDAIREGKQKAREAMVAAGMSRSNAGTPGAYGQNSQPGDAAAQMNGGPNLSRKRSRDGTQIPLNQSRTPAESEENHMVHDEILLDRYMQHDLVYSAAVNDQSERLRDLVKNKESERDFYMNEVRQRRHHNPGSIFGAGFRGYGNGTTNGPTKILYASQRAPPKGRHAGLLRTSRKDNELQAEQHEELVPIRLDLELDKLRLRDTFTWNLHEKLVTPELFIQHLIEDLKIPDDDINSKRRLSELVRGEMHEQILNYYPHVFVDDGPVEPGRPYFEHKDDEMRIMIKLNITIGRVTLIDQFEWDINNPQNLPEDFAKNMALENALSGEFTTAIAHSIREQSQLYTRSLWLTNHMFDGRPVEDPDVRDSFLSAPSHSTFRPQQAQKDWMPYLYEMSEAELERTETSMSREHRVQKRQLNRRGGPALPDLKERQRTVRSLLVHSVIPGAVATWETTGIPRARRAARSARRGGARADDDSDLEEADSDQSGPDSPAPANLAAGGTARTRGMRGAATAAQAAMRLNYGRSQTPDAQLLATPQDTRTSARRSMLRDGSVLGDNESLVVTLKIGRSKFKTWLQAYEAKKKAAQYPLSGYASQPPALIQALATPKPVRGDTPSKNAAQGTPTMTPKPLPTSRGTPQANGSTSAASLPPPTTRRSSSRQPGTVYDEHGRVETPRWPEPNHTPVSSYAASQHPPHPSH